MRPEKGAFRNRSKGRLPEQAISWAGVLKYSTWIVWP